MNIDCYDFYLWTMGELPLPHWMVFELINENETGKEPNETQLF